jgi:hypothetical protein
LFKFCFQLVWWMCVHPLLWLHFGFNIHKWKRGFITRYLYDVLDKFVTIFGVSKTVKTEAVLCICVYPRAISDCILYKACDSLV